MITPGLYATRLRRLLYISLCALPACICTVLLLLSPKANASITVWRDYFVLLIDAEAELEPVVDSLRAFGIEHVSDRNTRVFLSTFSGIEEVPLASLENRLDPDDPRYDPYMSALPGYFNARYRADSRHVLYVKSAGTQANLVRSLSRCLKPLGIEYRLPEWRPVWFFLGPAAVCGFFLLLVRDRGRALKLAILLVPLLVISAKASGLGLAAAFVLMPGWLYLGDTLRELLTRSFYNRKLVLDGRAMLKGIGLFSAGSACAYALSFFHTDPFRFLGVLSLTIAALAGWGVALSGRLAFEAGISCHRVFCGIPLLKGTGFQTYGRRDQTTRMCRALLAAIVVFTPALVMLSRIDASLSVAGPYGGNKGRRFKIERPADQALPDLADYLTHRAYQDSLLYSREWIFPVQESAVTLSSYSEENGRVVSRESRVISFDSQWFDGVIADAAIDGLGGMLLAQGGDVAVSRRNSEGHSGQRVLKPAAVAVLITIPLVYLLPSLTTYYLYGMRNLALRRKRQTA